VAQRIVAQSAQASPVAAVFVAPPQPAAAVAPSIRPTKLLAKILSVLNVNLNNPAVPTGGLNAIGVLAWGVFREIEAGLLAANRGTFSGISIPVAAAPLVAGSGPAPAATEPAPAATVAPPVAAGWNAGVPDPATGKISGSVVFTDPAGLVLSYSAPVTSTGGGAVTVNTTTGSFTYTPTQAQRQAATTSTTDSFTVTAGNGTASATQTIAVPVDGGTPVAGVPKVSNPNTSTGVVAGSVPFSDLAGRVLSYSAPAISTGGAAVVVSPTTGAFTYTPTQAQRQQAGATTTDTVTITADNGFNTAARTVTVKVDPGTPVVLPAVRTGFVATTGAISGTAAFTDTAGRTLSYSGPTTSVGGGSVSIDPVTGGYVYTPAPAQRLVATTATTDTFRLTASNGVVAVSRNVIVNVDPGTPVAGPAVLAPASPASGAVTGTAVFTDTAARPLTYTTSGVSAGGAAVALDPATGAFTYTPTAAQRRTATPTTVDTFWVTATNGARTVGQSVTVSVRPAVPVAGTLSVGPAVPNTGAISGTAPFTDSSGAALNTLTYTTPATSTGGGTVTITNRATGAFTYTPTLTQRQQATNATTDSFTITATNGIDTVSQVVTAKVDPGTPVAATPTVGTPNAQTGVVTGTVPFTDTAKRTLTYSAPATSTGGATVAVNPTTGGFTYTPTTAQRLTATASTTDTVTVTADNGVNTAAKTITVKVGYLAGIPTAGSAGVGTPSIDTGTATGTANFSDPYGRVLSYSTPATTTGGGTVTIDPTTGEFTYTPTTTQRQQAGLTTTDTFTITANNGVYTAKQTVTVTVDPGTPLAGTPTVGTPSTDTGTATGTVSFTDTAARPLTYTTTDTSTGGATITLDPTTGAFTYTPTTDQRRTATPTTVDTFTVTADNGVRTTTQTVTVSVDAGHPVAGSSSVGTPETDTGITSGSVSFTDTAGRTLTYTTVGTSTGGGTVAVDPITGAFTYTPTAGQRRTASDTTTDEFTVIADNGANTASRTVTVAVEPGVEFGTSQQSMITASGQIWGFVNGGNGNYTVSHGPQFGTVSVSPYGVYTYRPGASFTGTDSFTVTLSGGKLGSATRDVPVQVTADPAAQSGTVTDDFTGAYGSSPDPELWTNAPGWDAGWQTYVDSPENVRLDGQGNMVIQAMVTPYGYTSGRVTTQGGVDMLYGTMTARIKMPSGQGLWPAFWQLGSTYSQATWDAPDRTGWPGAGEIDVIELINNGNTYYTALHGPQGTGDYTFGNGQMVMTSGPIADLTTDFHNYWVMRQPNIIVIGVDDTVLGTYTPASLPAGATWAFNRQMFAIFNIAIGGPWAGPPNATTPWPSTMLVDSFTYTPYP
jgi:VCBS repeat-containing protein